MAEEVLLHMLSLLPGMHIIQVLSSIRHRQILIRHNRAALYIVSIAQCPMIQLSRIVLTAVQEDKPLYFVSGGELL